MGRSPSQNRVRARGGWGSEVSYAAQAPLAKTFCRVVTSEAPRRVVAAPCAGTQLRPGTYRAFWDWAGRWSPGTFVSATSFTEGWCGLVGTGGDWSALGDFAQFWGWAGPVESGHLPFGNVLSWRLVRAERNRWGLAAAAGQVGFGALSRAMRGWELSDAVRGWAEPGVIRPLPARTSCRVVTF